MLDTVMLYKNSLFVWDPDKNDANLHEHGLRFEDAMDVFFDPGCEIEDASRNNETRDGIIGRPMGGTAPLYVVHREVELFAGEEAIRIISVRPANPTETQRYYERWHCDP